MNQIDKNTVSAKGQLKESEFVGFPQLREGGKKVMFVGNSITKHGIAPQIGWNRECGMAASSIEKDYVHLLMSAFSEQDPNTSFCICQVAEWERNYREPAATLPLFESARAFEADVIVFRLIENCPSKDFDKDAFQKAFEELIAFLDPAGKAKAVIASAFWKHPGDGVLEKIAEEKKYPFVYLGDLGEDDRMKAIGLFEHSGVANHPGDLGMAAIAERIWEKIRASLSSKPINRETK